jgi:hypothetical protein
VVRLSVAEDRIDTWHISYGVCLYVEIATLHRDKHSVGSVACLKFGDYTLEMVLYGARIRRPQPSCPPPVEQDADRNTLHPKHLLERRRALDTFQGWPANELSSSSKSSPTPTSKPA